MRKQFLLFSFLSFVAFIAFSYIVHKDFLNQFDFDTTVRLQDTLGVLPERRAIDALFSSLSVFGSLEILTLVLILIMLYIRKFKSLILPLAFSFMHLIELFGKIFITQSGPPFMFLRTELPFYFPSFYVQPGFSYPSGHAARTIFISAILLYLILSSKKPQSLKLIIGVFLIVFNIVMLVSRVYLGEHWATDVIGGSLLGGSLAIFSLIFLPSKHSLRSNDLKQGGRESNPQ